MGNAVALHRRMAIWVRSSNSSNRGPTPVDGDLRTDPKSVPSQGSVPPSVDHHRTGISVGKRIHRSHVIARHIDAKFGAAPCDFGHQRARDSQRGGRRPAQRDPQRRSSRYDGCEASFRRAEANRGVFEFVFGPAAALRKPLPGTADALVPATPSIAAAPSTNWTVSTCRGIQMELGPFGAAPCCGAHEGHWCELHGAAREEAALVPFDVVEQSGIRTRVRQRRLVFGLAWWQCAVQVHARVAARPPSRHGAAEDLSAVLLHAVVSIAP